MSAALTLTLQMAPALVGAIVALGFDAFDRRVAAVASACVGLLVSGGFGVYAGMTTSGSTAFEVLRVGAVFSTVPGIIAILAALALWGGWGAFVGRIGGGSSAALVALAAVASAAVAQSFDLLMLLVALETAAAAGYALVAEARTSRSDESAMKYFVQGAIATGLLRHGTCGPGRRLRADRRVWTACECLLAAVGPHRCAGGRAADSGALWRSSPRWCRSTPGRRTPTSRLDPRSPQLFASGPKLGAIGAMALFMVVAASGTLSKQIIVVMAVIAALSILVGSVGALRQRSYTRMLGYAGVAQAGYALIGAVVLNPTAAVFFASTYAIATTGTFLAATAFRAARPSWDGSIEGLAGLGRGRARTAAVCVTVLLVSLAGIPPLLGFWGKFQVFAGAITLSGRMFLSSGDALLGWTYALLAVAGLVGSVVSLAYYGRVLQSLYMAEGDSADRVLDDAEEAARRRQGCGNGRGRSGHHRARRRLDGTRADLPGYVGSGAAVHRPLGARLWFL